MDNANRRSFTAPLRRLRRGPRWIIIGLLVLVLVYAGISVALHALLDADYLEGRINSALSASGDSLYRVDLEQVEWSLWRRSLQADHVEIHPHPDVLQQLQEMERSPATLYHATVPGVRLQGIHLWTLFWHRALSLNAASIQQPYVRIEETGREPSSADSERGSASSDQPARSVHAALSRRLPSVKIRRLTLSEGAAARYRAAARAPADTLWGVSLEIDELVIDSTSAQDTSRVLFSENMSVTLEGYRRVFADSLYAFTLGPVRASSRAESLSIEAIRLAPTVSDRVFMERHAHRTNRFITAASRFAVGNVDFRRFVEEQALLAEQVQVDSLILKVYRNNHLPPPPEGPPPKMPHEHFQALTFPIRLDTIRVRDGYISYTELAEDAAAPGTITFEELSASITNVTNDSSRMTPSTPAVVYATTQVAGAGWLRTTIRMPLLSPHLALSYQGRLGAMDATAFNEAFVNIAGVRIESGRVDSLWFEADVQRGVANGTLEGVYRSLEVETLDKKSGDRGIKNRIETIILNGLMLESSNTPEEGDLRTADINHEHNEKDPFFKFLWRSVRSGLLSLVGM